MFKKLAVIGALSATLMLGACAGTSTTTPPAGGGSTVDPTVQAIQDAAVKACGFLPAISTVSAIITSFIPGAGATNALVTQVASSICNAVAPKNQSSLRRAGPPVVQTPNGPVTVNGQFVR